MRLSIAIVLFCMAVTARASDPNPGVTASPYGRGLVRQGARVLAVFTNASYVDMGLWFKDLDHTNRSFIWFGNPAVDNGVNFLWNPTHDDPNGLFGGELQMTAPQFAIGFGQDSVANTS